MPTVYLPTPLRPPEANLGKIQVPSGTIKEIIAILTSRHPIIKAKILDDRGSIRRYVNIFVNSDDIRSLNNEATVVHENDEIVIVPAMAGG
jgi:molybdopterin synthase sulfur carrier subunit